MIRLEEVTKVFGAAPPAVDRLSIEIPAGELVVLVGPSGCGKTTTMKMINRLVEPTSGRILLDGEDITTGDPVLVRRRIGYVIQRIGLFPHQKVAANVGTVPRLLGWDRRRIDERVDELLALVGLDPAVYRNRYPHELSGGQRQRVGVARALGADPPVLLMDEPFGAIDPITRDRLQGEFLRLQAEMRKTVVFVTHDIDEAVRLGDRIAVFADGGRLAQYDTPAAILARPADDFVAAFVGRDRSVRRLDVVMVGPGSLASGVPADPAASPGGDGRPVTPTVTLDHDGRAVGWRAGPPGEPMRTLPGSVVYGERLRDALAALLDSPLGWIAVSDADGRHAGVLTLESLHSAASVPSAGADEGEPRPSTDPSPGRPGC